MNADSIAAFLAERIVGATSRGNVLEVVAVFPPPLEPRKRAQPLPARRIGLSRNGLDFSWTRDRNADLSPEGVHVKKLSENLRHDLKLAYKATGETA